MTRPKTLARRYWWTLLVGLGVLVTLGYPKHEPRFEECVQNIWIDLMPMPGETEEEYDERWKEAVLEACRDLS